VIAGAPGTDTAVAAADDRAPLTGYRPGLLLFATAFGALSGIVYELLLASLASYLLGLPVLVFSLTVGGFLASMGVGAYLSRFVDRGLLPTFLRLELLLALFGGALPLALFAVYAVDGPYLPLHALGTAAIGVLTGIELPLITRMLERAGGLRVAISRVLALDYAGALVGSVLFPLVLLPFAGLIGAAVLTGAGGALVVAVVAWGHRRTFDAGRRLAFAGLAAAVVLIAGARPARRVADTLEERLYKAPIVARVQTPYQRIVLTRRRDDVRLFLDGDLQFSSLDEHRYHEALVHPALSLHGRPARVLLLGAGDGLALREILKYRSVREVVVIELDREMIALATRHPTLVRLNGNSFADARVRVVVGDAFAALHEAKAPLDRPFDVIIADFPDPDTDAVARLYSTTFFGWARRLLAGGGLFITQSSSPFFAPDAFFCVARTMADAGLVVRSYTVDVPSFGPWGFHLAAAGAPPPDPARLHLGVPTRYLTDAVARDMFDLPADLRPRPDLQSNRLLDPVLVRYHHDTRWAAYD
jgi:spermidine synthase